MRKGPASCRAFRAPGPVSVESQGLRDSFWMQGMQAGFNAVYDCIKAFSETDQTDDLEVRRADARHPG